MSGVTTPGAVADDQGKDGADAADHEFWHNKWRSNQIGFHEEAIHPLLQAHWDALDVAQGGTVFVPLCGKSHDMSWLHARGCHVIGVEISEIAVQAFFAESAIAVETGQHGAYARYTAPGYTVLCGDFFDLDADILGPVAAIYDRAALIALPAAARQRYVDHLYRLCGAAGKMLLITLQYTPGLIRPPPYTIEQDAVEALFSAWPEVVRVGAGDATVKAKRCRETAFRIGA